MSDYFSDDENGHGDRVIEVRQSRGDVILSVRLTAEEMDMLDVVARDMDLSDNETVRQMVVYTLTQHFNWVSVYGDGSDVRKRPGLVTRR